MQLILQEVLLNMPMLNPGMPMHQPNRTIKTLQAPIHLFTIHLPLTMHGYTLQEIILHMAAMLQPIRIIHSLLEPPLHVPMLQPLRMIHSLEPPILQLLL